MDEKKDQSHVDSDDSSGEPLKKGHEVLDRFPLRNVSFEMPLIGGEIYFNGATSLIGFLFLWGLALWCMVDRDGSAETLSEWKSAVSEKFTWFYICSNPAFTFFVIWLAWRYGDVKLGKTDEEPEFSDSAYFMMLFSAGVAVGLFFYGVSEPLWHQNSHWFASVLGKGDDEVDQFAMMITLYHWGFAGWSPYLVVAIAAGLASYRFDLPLTVRSCFYEVLGEYTWGWLGDVIDGFSIVTTVAGVCTSLGLGAMQVIAGAKRMGWVGDDLTEDELTGKHVTVIIVVTLLATASVITGLKVGVKLLSQFGFGLGMVLLFLCMTMEKTNYLFNLTVQTIGYYFQYCIFQVPFWTDAFGQLQPGEGRATDGQAAATWWMDAWTVFYMAWWTAWGAFVGLFIARISRGRTIRVVVLYSFIAPLVYSFLWFSVFGGIGLRQARQARELAVLGETHFGDENYFKVPDSATCYNVPQTDVYAMVDGKDTVVFTNSLPGITPVCELDSSDATQAWFNVMFSFSYPDDDGFGGFGKFMAALSIVAIITYFVTSSDSGSLVVDNLASNGHDEHHFVQRVFWAFTEGAVAIALLVAGGSGALGALQAASIVFGLPFNLFLYVMMINTVKQCELYEQEQDNGKHRARIDLPRPEDNSFNMPLYGGIFNIFEVIFSLGSVHPEREERGMGMPAPSVIVDFFTALLAPMLPLMRLYNSMGTDAMIKYLNLLVFTLCHVGWIVMFIMSYRNMGFVAFGFTFFFLNACIIGSLRAEIREKFKLNGNAVGDFMAGSFLYPQTLTQLLWEFQFQENGGEGGDAVAVEYEANETPEEQADA